MPKIDPSHFIRIIARGPPTIGDALTIFWVSLPDATVPTVPAMPNANIFG
jgi:hypothetical protein